jgi:N-acyl-D-aspartate/D-glutamate deacylase
MFDILIKDALIVDGSGKKAFKGSLGIKDGKIEAVGALEAEAKMVIEAEGLMAAPGFVDIHSHGDETLLLYPKAQSHLMQGVTTIVGGNCGFSPAPLGKWWLLSFWEFDWWHKIAPYKYYEPILQPLDKVVPFIRKHGIEVDWRNFGQFLDKIEKEGISVNYVPLVGHNTIRAAVMGDDHQRDPTEEEIKQMEKLLMSSLAEGAFGLSSGLDYPPGSFAKTHELIKLGEAIRKYNGIYATHWRRTGIRRGRRTKPQEKIKGIEEAIKIAKATEVPLQISHILSGYTIYPPPPPSLAKAAAEATLELIDQADVNISFDVIPNTDGGVVIAPYLASGLAPWLREIGSLEGLAERLKAKDFQEEIREVIEAGKWWAINPHINPYWPTQIRILRCKTAEYEGKTLAEITEERGRGKDPLDVMFEIVIEDPQTKINFEGLTTEEEVITYLKHKQAMVGIDTFTFDDTWEISCPPYFLPHPNTYGAYPRYIRRYVRETKALSIEEAIYKATHAPAKKMGLKGRGIIERGAFADIVIFNYDELSEGGDYLEPRRYPKGIKYVIVNGKIVVEKGKHTKARPGKVFRRA